MNSSIAIYPSVQWRQQTVQWSDYLEKAGEYGFREVFSSIHLPELALKDQVEMLEELARTANHLGMELTVDIGGGEIGQLLADSQMCARVRSAGIGLLRLDYGFCTEQAGALYNRLGIKGFVVNASIYDREEAEAVKKNLTAIDSRIELRACHNFYPRPETGLDREFFNEQNRIFAELGLITYACIPGKSHPRPPLGLGLPTLEQHRGMNLEQVCVDLVCSPGIGGVMAADEFFNETELACVARAVNREALTLQIRLETGVGQVERELILGMSHHIRYDSNRQVLRSRTSREMSRIGAKVAPGLTGERRRGMVTVDNERYGRYSSEVQILLADLEADSRVNCCGQISEEDMWKLDFYRQGFDYQFQEITEIGEGIISGAI
ncbi:MupG family TIM beta-alpha barrel fold protein [Enterocloster asparagiformis]|uniref:MupG family TIM beta-alpha barrel fold protein n=1 Tax=Enterocloster asparagiformis TaxID=333367 RepID=UPI002A832325|nr:MupG family TIM beta-alpha barrel fold protein [Enterocloster asparagiformis]